MSWDGAVFRSKSGSYASFDPADIEPISVEQVYEAICAEFPGTDTSDPEWMVFDNGCASVVFSVTPDHYVSLNVHLVEDDYETELINRIRRFADKLRGRAFDYQSFEFI